MQLRGPVERIVFGLALVALLGGGCKKGDNNAAGGGAAPVMVSPQVTGPYTTAPTETALPAVTKPIPVATPIIYAAWVHPSLPSSEQITCALTAVDVGAAAPAGTLVASAKFTAQAAGPYHGTEKFSAPTKGWPPGQYRITATGNTVGQLGTLDFSIQ